MSYIYRTLKKKCEEDSSLTPLLAQWEFDQKLLANALRSVVYSFPHYSMHDESHSNTILIQIEKVLGKERIESLYGTDLWLLLEAAYSHDLGMVIPEKDKKEALESPQFNEYLEEIIQDKNHENYNEAVLIKTPEFKELLEKSPKIWPLDVSRSVTILLAEYFRSKHATRSKDLINQPSIIGLKSPRTGLIPSRLFNLLGKITESHGKDHKYVMSLPQYEDGMGMDKCHPRLIAFLLRLGDLLDIDNGRFCPVMLSSFGKLPPTSENHLDKHDSIERLYISRSHIEITARAKNYEVHSLLSNWFDWIKNEIDFMNKNLSSIIPSDSFGGFPVANKLKVELLDFETVENSQRPKIDIDSEKIFEMLRGTNLYSSSNVFIRELLQNSIDATLLKYFYDNKNTIYFMKSPKDLFSELYKKDSYKISINISEVQIDDSRLKIKLEIEDAGIGISREEISYILKMGTSNKNLRRQKLLKQMPEWMKPSGYFGIGFHSIFQAVDSITISTKSIYDSLEYEINFKEKGKQVKIRKIENEDNITKSFTKISIEIDSEKIPKRFTYKYENDKALETISNYDSLLDDSFAIEKANLIYDINLFATNYQIPIYLNGLKLNIRETLLKGVFLSDSNCYLNLKPVMNRLPGSDISYRNQTVLKNTRDLYLKYLIYELDIMEGKANDYLSFSREKLSLEGKKIINDILELEIPKLLESMYKQDSDDKKLISLAYHSNFDKSNDIIKDDWKDFEINGVKENNKQIKLREILSKEQISVSYKDMISSMKTLNIKTDEEEYIVDQRLDIIDFLAVELFKEYHFFQLNSISSNTESKIVSGNFPIQDRIIKKEFKFSKEIINGEIISSSALKYFFKNYSKLYQSGDRIKRTFIPKTNKKFDSISMEINDLIFNLPYIQPIYQTEFQIYQKCIINPFVVEEGKWILKGLEEAKQKTFEIKRETDKLIKLEDISKLFDELVEDIKGILKDESGE